MTELHTEYTPKSSIESDEQCRLLAAALQKHINGKELKFRCEYISNQFYVVLSDGFHNFADWHRPHTVELVAKDDGFALSLARYMVKEFAVFRWLKPSGANEESAT